MIDDHGVYKRQDAYLGGRSGSCFRLSADSEIGSVFAEAAA